MAPSASAQVTLARIEPGALQPGKTVELTLHGDKFAEPLRVWSSFPAQWEVLPLDPVSKGKVAKVKGTLDAAAPAGIGGIAVATPAGLSDVLLVMADDLPSVAEIATNHAFATPQEITTPVAVDGSADGAAFDYFKFTAKAGEPLSMEVVGARLASDFDPVLRLLDASGKELATADDDPSLGADGRLRYTFPADGQYVVELRDNRYRSGGRYRLRIGNFPLVSTAYPLSVQTGSAAEIGVAGPLVQGISPQSLTIPTSGVASFAAKLPGGNASGMARVLASRLPVVLEATSPDKPDKPDEPTAVTLPAAINGRLEAARDRDAYRFTATKGMRVRFEPQTRSLGSAAILMLRVVDAAGKQLVETPVTDADEVPLTFVAPADGEYRLVVEDLVGRGGPDFAYCITAEPGASFTLQLKNVPANQQAKVSYSLPPSGGAFALQVECVRDGYDGPIELAVDSPRAGWQTFGNLIGEKGKETKLYIVAPADLTPGEIAPLRIVGRATIDGSEKTATLTNTTQLRATRPALPYPPQWLDGLVTVGGAADSPSFYKLTPDKTEIVFPRLVGQAKLTLTMDRTDAKFKDQPLTVLPLDLPAGMSTEVKRVGNGPQEKYEIILTGPKDLAEGKHKFRYFTYAEIPGQARAVVSGDVPLSVVTPLAITLVPAGPLTQGQKQKVKVTLVRAGEDRQPVEVKFTKLPTGVTGPPSVTIPADQNELDVELDVAADAPVGKFDDVAASAATKYAGQDLAVESAKVSLEVKAP